MTCERHYTPTAIAEMQQITATVEAERWRQYRAEMVQELGKAFGEKVVSLLVSMEYGGDTPTVVMGIVLARKILVELSPPVVCDNETK